MATPTQQQIDYALMTGATYVSSRNIINQIPTPSGWTSIYYQSYQLSGLEATAFQSGNNIVISYAGTNPTSVTDWANNLALGSVGGVLSPQLYQAAEFYLQIAALVANNPNATISFTGHSLGGGLASLMAVFFNHSAITFDQAPFALSANVLVAASLQTYLQLQGYSASALQGLADFVSNTSLFSIPNSSNVTDINVQGEFLSLATSGLRIGSQTDIANSAGLTLAADLHSQALLSAFLLSDQAAALTAKPNETLDAVTLKLPDLLKMIFNGQLYSNSESVSNTTNPNFIDLIVQHQQGFSGVPASVTSGSTPFPGTTVAAITPDQMVTRFTADLWKLAQDGGMTMNDRS